MGQPFAPRPSGRPIPRALGIWPTAQSARNLADRLDSTAQIKPPTAHPATASFHPTATITTIGADATAAATNSIDAAKPTRRRSDAGWFGRGCGVCGVVIAPTVVAQAPPARKVYGHEQRTAGRAADRLSGCGRPLEAISRHRREQQTLALANGVSRRWLRCQQQGTLMIRAAGRFAPLRLQRAGRRRERCAVPGRL